jgi:hypothetical protein
MSLERLKELMAAATPGPWDRDGLYNVLRIAKKSLDWELVNPTEDASMPDEDDAEFIAALHEALPDLLAVVEAAVAVLDNAYRDRLGEDFILTASEFKALRDALAKLTEEV